jgi:hypothetical protein
MSSTVKGCGFAAAAASEQQNERAKDQPTLERKIDLREAKNLLVRRLGLNGAGL